MLLACIKLISGQILLRCILKMTNFMMGNYSVEFCHKKDKGQTAVLG